jgi:hypothetical protein
MPHAAARPLVIALALVASGLAGVHLAPQASGQTGDGWVTLLDSKTMGDWNKLGDTNWRLEDGAVVADKNAGKDPAYLVSKTSYKDFQIYAEFWASDDANSGIFVRCQEPNRITDENCYEANIFDQRPDPSYGTGAIVKVAKVEPMPKAGGKWNTYEITAQGKRLVLVLNGRKTVDIEDGKLASGPVALQWGRGTIRWRKGEIRPL